MDTLTPREFAEQHSLSPSYVYKLLREGKIPGAERQGGRWVIPADAQISPPTKRFAPELGRLHAFTLFNFAGGWARPPWPATWEPSLPDAATGSS